MKTILVVEDDPHVLRIIDAMLATADCYDILNATSAEAGLRVGLKYPGPIHLLLADVIMPGMIGTEVARQIKEVRPDMRVILMSGKAEGELAVLASGFGWAFLKKPFVAQALLSKIQIALMLRAAGGR